MGDVVHQDKNVTLDVVHKLAEALEVDYFKGGGDREKEKIADVVVFVLVSFLAGLRGEEILRIVLGETMDFPEVGQAQGNRKHMRLPLRGIVKGDSGESYHLVVVTAKYNSRLQSGR